MHITLLTYGSRGDFQPFLALALGLQKAGHKPRLAAAGRFEDQATQSGVEFSALPGDPAEISLRLNDAGTNPLLMIRSIQDYILAIAPQVVRETRLALQGADLVIHSFLFTTGGHSFAREMGIPDISVQTFPMFAATRAFPNVALAWLPPGPFSYLSHWLATQIFWYGGNSGLRGLRKRHLQDFPHKLTWPFKQYGDRPLTPLVYAYSPTVLPRPADWSAANIHIPGYFFLDEPEYQPPPILQKFLETGEAPVCISFGSNLNREKERIQSIMIEALMQNRQRGILLTGWGGEMKQEHSPNILALPEASHAWLLPHCMAVVHHGGAGTTGAGLRAGIPNIVVPSATDQPFWARRVAELEAGPQPIPLKHLTTASLAAGLMAAQNDLAMRVRAARVGEMIRAENGVEKMIR
ncbi:MAG: glycosyltransferase, partial [Chloroflexota bacterium]